MDTTGIGIGDVAALRGLGVFGNGFFGNGMYGGLGMGVGPTNFLRESALADGTAAKTASDCHAQALEASLARTSAQALETREILRTDQTNKNFSDAEFREADRLRDVNNLITAGQKEQANCCCETQKLILQESNATQKEVTAQACATRELMQQLDKDNILRNLATAERKAETAEIIKAITAANSGNCSCVR